MLFLVVSFSNFRPWYKETVSTVRKDVVIVFDKSLSMVNYLPKTKIAVKAVLNTLGPNDRVRETILTSVIFAKCGISSLDLKSLVKKTKLCKDIKQHY